MEAPRDEIRRDKGSVQGVRADGRRVRKRTDHGTARQRMLKIMGLVALGVGLAWRSRRNQGPPNSTTTNSSMDLGIGRSPPHSDAMPGVLWPMRSEHGRILAINPRQQTMTRTGQTRNGTTTPNTRAAPNANPQHETNQPQQEGGRPEATPATGTHGPRQD